MWISGGTTNVLSMALIPQYNTAITTSSGAEARERKFLARKSRGDSVISARRPRMNVIVASVRPRIVKYCQCQPLIHVSIARIRWEVSYQDSCIIDLGPKRR